MRSRHFPQKTALALLVGLYVSSPMAYTEMGALGNTKSWESPEYLNDWGLGNMHASTAYAMGFTGKGVNIGIMDSGVKLDHQAFNGSSVTAVRTQGEYFSNNVRYPDKPADQQAPYKKGEKFDVDGGWHKGLNDHHGTHVGGSMVASRDGNEMHGVAFEANLFSANTGGTDSMTYGPYQDYNFFLKGYTALADSGVKAVNNSWGSNRRINSAFPGAWGYWYYKGVKDEWTPDEIAENPTLSDLHMNLRDLGEAKKAYYQFATKGEKTFLDAAYEVAVQRQMVQTFTAGNRDEMQESFTRAMLPYFRPDAEKYWINVTGNNEQDIQRWNMAGHSKYWTIAAPSTNINSARVDYDKEKDEVKSYYKLSSGTSMAAPHVTAALGVIMQRYPDLTPDQAREIMLTTARQTTESGNILEKWTAPLGVPDERWGWGIVDLGKAMFGPGQFLGTFNAKVMQDDIWSNNISDTAIKFRKTEDENEAAEWTVRKAELQARTDLTANEKAELQVGLDREIARNQRAEQGYQGALIKSGQGTLTLAGNNSFTGSVTVLEGRLAGLNQSFGQQNQINVKNGAQLQVLPNVDVIKPSEAGYKTEVRQSRHVEVNANIEQGGTFVLSNGVANLALKFAQGSQVQAAEFDEATRASLLRNPEQTIVYRGKGTFEGIENAEAVSPYAYFKPTKTLIKGEQSAVNSGTTFLAASSANGDTLELSLKKVAMSDTARSDNEAAIANAIEHSGTSALYQELLFANTAQANTIFDSLNYDADLATQQHKVINNLMLSQQLNQPVASQAKLDSNSRIWTTGSYNRFSSENVASGKLHTNSYNQLIGADFNLNSNSKVGALFGVTTSKHKFTNRTNDRELHVGFYGEHQFEPFSVKAGFIHSWGKQDHQIALAQGKSRTQSENLFAEFSHSGWIGDNFALETYFGAGYQHLKTKGFTQGEIRIKDNKRDLLSTSFGLRPSLPFAIGSVKFNLQGDLAYHRFYNDNEAQATMLINNQGVAQLYSQKLTHLVTTGVALHTQFTPAFSIKLGYQGAYNKDTKANGFNAQLKYAF